MQALGAAGHHQQVQHVALQQCTPWGQLCPILHQPRLASQPRLKQRFRNQLHCCSTQRQDLYAVLGVAYDADASAVKAAFRAKAKQVHPDVNKADDADAAFRLLKRAHEVLSDSMLRAAYDSELQDWLPEAAAAARARDPRFARFERWRREIMPDLEGQLEAWTQEVMQLLATAEAALRVYEQEYLWHMVRAAPPPGAASSLDWHSSNTSSSSQGLQQTVHSMRNTLSDAVANVQRLYDKRYDQMQTRFPAYPDIVWYDKWLEVSDGWLDASARLVQTWQPRIAAAAQWLPAGGTPVCAGKQL